MRIEVAMPPIGSLHPLGRKWSLLMRLRDLIMCTQWMAPPEGLSGYSWLELYALFDSGKYRLGLVLHDMHLVLICILVINVRVFVAVSLVVDGQSFPHTKSFLHEQLRLF